MLQSRLNHEDEFYDAVEPGTDTTDSKALSGADENENNVISVDSMTHRHRLTDEVVYYYSLSNIHMEREGTFKSAFLVLCIGMRKKKNIRTRSVDY